MRTIIIEPTENSKVMKFVADYNLMPGSLELDRTSDVSELPLAKKLFVYPFVERIFITECGYLVKKKELETKDDKKNRDNSKYRIVYKEVRYSKELKDKYDNMNKEDIKPYYTSEAIRKKYIFIKKLIENKIYKKLISGKDGY